MIDCCYDEERMLTQLIEQRTKFHGGLAKIKIPAGHTAVPVTS